MHSRPVTGGVSGSLAVTTLSRQHLPNALRSVERGVVEVIFEIDGWPVVELLLGGEKRGQAFIPPCSTYFFSQFTQQQGNRA